MLCSEIGEQSQHSNAEPLTDSAARPQPVQYSRKVAAKGSRLRQWMGPMHVGGVHVRLIYKHTLNIIIYLDLRRFVQEVSQ